MTKAELEQDVWDSLPVARRLIGRQRVNAIVQRALRDWPVGVLCQCDAADAAIVQTHFTHRLERRERQYGMGFIALFVLGGIISAIVQHLMKRWLENRMAFMEACL